MHYDVILTQMTPDPPRVESRMIIQLSTKKSEQDDRSFAHRGDTCRAIASMLPPISKGAMRDVYALT